MKIKLTDREYFPQKGDRIYYKFSEEVQEYRKEYGERYKKGNNATVINVALYNHWLDRCIQISEYTNNSIKAHLIRPDQLIRFLGVSFNSFALLTENEVITFSLGHSVEFHRGNKSLTVRYKITESYEEFFLRALLKAGILIK